MTTRRDLITDILDLVTALARDDVATRATLALLRNGHPQAARYDHAHKGDEHNGWSEDGPQLNDGPEHPDPTGEMALQHDEGVRRLREYRFHLRQIHRHCEQADAIRRYAKPDVNKAKTQVDPNSWCHNCLTHGYCNPRTSNGGLYCKWCTSVRQSWGFLPPSHIVELHESGDKAKLVPALQTWKKQQKK